MMPTDCSVRCTPTILSGIRISWDYHPTFMSTLRFGRSKTNIHWMFCSISGLTATGRALPFCNLSTLSTGLSSFVSALRFHSNRGLPLLCLRSASVGAKRTSTGCSAPYRGGSQGLSSTYEQAHVDLDLLTLASSYHIE